MAGENTTYSESWHLVAHLHLKLRSTVEVQRQFYRGEKWYVLQDPFTNRFFRLQPAAYEFIMRLSPEHSVEEVWLNCLKEFPDQAPGQGDVVSMLGQLYAMNLLETDVSPDTRQMFARYSQNRQKEKMSQLLNILFLRLPLFDPEPLLQRLSWLIHRIISIPGAIVWFTAMVVAAKLIVDNSAGFFDSAQGVLAPGNLFLLYLALVFVKSVHEFGHAAVCHRFGGEVHTMGVMFMIFTPLPYMDATSSWGFRNRWERALVGAAGMISELFIAAFAAMYWALSGEGVLHSLAYNVMFVASISTLLFNINPLLRLDGYYILSDLIDIPNLHTRAVEHLKYLLEHHVFHFSGATPVAKNHHEEIELTLYGVLSSIYKVLIFFGITLFVADKWLILGTLLAIAGVVTGFLFPLYRFIRYLFFDARLYSCRPRVASATALFLLIFFVVTGLLPFPRNISAPGIVESYPDVKVMNLSAGSVVEYLVTPGQRVVTGQPLVRLENPELDFALASAESRVTEIRVRERLALGKRVADLKPVQQELAAALAALAELQRDKQALLVRARAAGQWIPATRESIAGMWVERGRYIGSIVGGSRFRFAAVVPQEEASELFRAPVNRIEVKLWGEAFRSIATESVTLVPYQHEKLPSAALGQQAGGSVAVVQNPKKDPDNAAEPFFLVNALLNEQSGVHLLHGRSGTIRMSLSPEPLLVQWTRSIYQLFQKRYQLS